MRLFVATFSDNSYRFVISADDINSAWDKAKEHIKNNYSWYDINRNRIGYDIKVDVCDDDYVIQ